MIVKEYCEENNTVVIRRGDYANSLKAINELVVIAETDFPMSEGDLEEIKIVQYGGERYKRTHGIEFKSVLGDASEEYSRIRMLELRI